MIVQMGGGILRRGWDAERKKAEAADRREMVRKLEAIAPASRSLAKSISELAEINREIIRLLEQDAEP